MNKVLVIGLDGATWALLQHWMDRGHLPHLSTLQQEGASGVLRSTIPVITSAAWSAFATGKEPSNTGIFTFYYRDSGTYSVRTNTRLRVNGTSLWRQLSQQGKRSIVINVPMTYPAERDVNGLMITGLLTPHKSSQGFTHPSNLFEQYHLDKKRYIIRIRPSEYEGRYADLITDLKRMVRERLGVAEILIQEPWDLFVVHFYATDLAQHALWRFIDSNHPQHDEGNARKYGNGLLEVFSEVDRAIGELLRTVDLDKTTILVLSDHGFGPNHFTIHINRWLQEIGMLKLRQPLAYFGCRMLDILIRKARLSPHGSTARVIRSVASIPGYLPVPLQSLLNSGLGNLFSRSPRLSPLFDLRGYTAMFEAICWERTRAYSIGTSGLIYINLQGREPLGIVSSGREYEEVRNFIVSKLLNLMDENGRKLIDRVYRKEEIYHGRFLDEAPDLIPFTETLGCYFYPFLDREGVVTEAESFRSGNHRIEGIFIAKGPSVRKNQKVESAQIIDMTPTILYLLGIPIPYNMDGSVVGQIFESNYLKEHPLHKIEDARTLAENQTIAPGDEGEIAQKLRDLGYL